MKMRKLVSAAVGICALIFWAGTSLACTVMPWNFEDLAGRAEALVRGRVIRVEEGGRVAVLAVTEYLGPGTVSRELRVGPTENSGGREFECPDLSVVFHRGQEYIVLLDGNGPASRLAHPKGKTAVPVDAQGMIQVRMDSAEKRSAQAFMLEFAVRHGRVAWGEGWGQVRLVLAVVIVAGLGVGLAAWFGRRRRTRS